MEKKGIFISHFFNPSTQAEKSFTPCCSCSIWLHFCVWTKPNGAKWSSCASRSGMGSSFVSRIKSSLMTFCFKPKYRVKKLSRSLSSRKRCSAKMLNTNCHIQNNNWAAVQSWVWKVAALTEPLWFSSSCLFSLKEKLVMFWILVY